MARLGGVVLFVGFLCVHVARAQPPTGSSGCSNPSACGSYPCAASLRGDVGCTTLEGTEIYDHETTTQGGTIASNAHIYGPFEAGFSSAQDSIITGWGCTTASLAYDAAGGLDIGVATRKVAAACSVDLPKVSGTTYTGLVGPCGGHTNDYHFHGSFACVGCVDDTTGHSTKVGELISGMPLYGKWEDKANNKLPLLDACGCHWGRTPDSPDVNVYHCHVQDKAPFTSGCHHDGSSTNVASAVGLVSVTECKALYGSSLSNGGCNGASETLTIKNDDGSTTTKNYDRDCPCFDANGNNVGTIVELPAIAAVAGVTDPLAITSAQNSFTATASDVVHFGIIPPMSGTHADASPQDAMCSTSTSSAAAVQAGGVLAVALAVSSLAQFY